MSLFGYYYIPAFLIINPILFYRNGPSISHLMSLSSFRNIYVCRKKSLTVMATIILIIVLHGLEFTIFAGSLNMKNKRTFWTVILEFFTNYYICIISFMPCFALNYVKFATFEMLNTISTRMVMNESKYTEILIKEIGQMANANRRLSTILSPMLLIFISISVLDMIVLFMWFKEFGWNFFHTLLASLLTWFYIAYLISLDNRIQRIFRQTINEMIDNEIFECCGHCKQNEYDYIRRNDRKAIRLFYCIHKQRIIECYRLYEQYFYMNLFDICHINYQFILDSFLFVLIFVVLSLQT